jgi:hypothetical protein
MSPITPVPILTVPELERYMRACFSEEDNVEAAVVIAAVQSELEAKLGRPVMVRSFVDVIDLGRPAWSEFVFLRPNLYLPNTPVKSGTLVVEADGVTQDLSVEWVRTWGIRDYRGAIGTDGTVTATYDAGFDGRATANAALLLAVKRAAQREMSWREDQTQGTKRTSDEGYSVESVQPEGFFTAAELNGLSRYRRRRVSA